MSAGVGSHSTLLSAAFMITEGPVLELGTGLSSTPMLHGLCGSAKRRLHSVETSPQWFHELSPEYMREWHTFDLVENFLNLPEYQQDWGLAFVDHGVIEERHVSIMALKHVPMVVVHDTCHPRLYHYNEAFSHFKYRFDLALYGPMTSVVSDIIDVSSVFWEFVL